MPGTGHTLPSLFESRAALGFGYRSDNAIVFYADKRLINRDVWIRACKLEVRCMSVRAFKRQHVCLRAALFYALAIVACDSPAVMADAEFSGSATRVASATALVNPAAAFADSPNASGSAERSDLWAHGNLIAWCVPPFDALKHGPEERAQMLEKLGFKQFAFDWRVKDVQAFDAEIDAMQKHRIDVVGWALYEADTPGVTVNWKDFTVWDAPPPSGNGTVLKDFSVDRMLKTFKRHNIHPQIWLIQPWFNDSLLQASRKNMSQDEMRRYVTQLMRQDFPKTPEGQKQRVEQEAQKIAALARLAAPYGVKVELYTHNFWFGMVDNEIAVIGRLKQLGVTDVGIVYDFVHTRDDLHDDTVNFPEIWNKVKPYVVAVNVTPRLKEGTMLNPGQNSRSLEMLRTIEQSGWKGP